MKPPTSLGGYAPPSSPAPETAPRAQGSKLRTDQAAAVLHQPGTDAASRCLHTPLLTIEPASGSVMTHVQIALLDDRHARISGITPQVPGYLCNRGSAKSPHKREVYR